MKLALFILSCCFLHVYAVKSCYDCEPTSEGNCIDPQNFNVKTTNCESTSETQFSPTGLALEYACYRLYIAEGDKSGTYRGCVDAYTGDGCEHLKINKGITFDKCEICSGDKCNVENFSDEKDNPGGGAAEIVASLFILTVGAVFAIRGL